MTHTLAKQAGIDVPASKRRSFASEYHTFCVQRFDRSADQRRFYASAMALLRKHVSDGSSCGINCPGTVALTSSSKFSGILASDVRSPNAPAFLEPTLN